MALPKQVQAQLAEVEELEKSLTARRDRPEDAKTAKTEDQTDTAVEATDPETEAAARTGKAKPADTAPTDVEEETFAQKYKTLQGKYDAEVPRLHQQIRDLNAKLQDIENAQQKRTSEPTKPKEKVSYVTDADRAEFGEELLDVQRRVAREVAEEYQEQIATQAKVIKELEAKITNTGSQLGHMNFAQRLVQLVPDFEKVDRDERWVAWLNEHDPMLRAPRRTQAKAAFDAGDAEAVAHYVGLWKSSIADTQEPVKAKRQAELEKQVAPNRSANSVKTQSVGRDSKVYSAREVEAAWTKIRTLNTRGMLDEAAKLEAEITAAYLEGRVRQ
jgi:hypothetical protein